MSTLRPISRLVALSLLGATAGAACVALAFALQPTLTFEMDRELPRMARGFYEPERDKDETFAWTTNRASVRLDGLNRAADWTCSVRLRGARPGQPLAHVAVDGVTRATISPGNRYQDVAVDIPRRSSPGATLTIDTVPTFTPGPSDPRDLGVQVDRIACSPVRGFVMPPRRVVIAAALSAAAFGAALACLSLPTWAAQLATALLAAAQAVPLARGPGPYDAAYLALVPWVAGWIALATVIGVAIVTRWRRTALGVAASVAVACSAGPLFLELLALLHPSKALVDAVFHAHRLEFVLGGHYFFTQPMPSGVQFPYAIALYVIAAPWSALTNNHVALLEIVVSVSRALAGLLLYPMVTRAWGDRGVAVLSVAIFHLVPLPFVVIGNANLTYAFGQAMSVAALALAASAQVAGWRFAQLVGLFVIASIAFLSHVGLFPLLLTMLLVMTSLYLVIGGPALRAQAGTVGLAVALAAVFAVVSYYGQFWESYKTLIRVRSGAAAVSSAPATAGDASAAPGVPAARADRTSTTLGARTVRALRLAVGALGWPLLLLTLAGVWRVARQGARDPLGLMLVACGGVSLAFVGFSIATPVEAAFERYADEFVSRVYFAALPAIVVLAARGAAWAWQAGLAARAASVVLLGAATVSAARAWLAWLQ